MRSLSHIQAFTYTEANTYLRIDTNSKRNLELIQSIRGGDAKGTLLWLLDETVTAMGGRKLKQWMHQPLANKQAIEARQNVVTELLEEFFLRDELSQLLKNVYDLERLAGRVAFGSVGGRDLAQLRESLRQVPTIQQKLIESGREKCVAVGQSLDLCTDIEQLLANAITDHPPISIKEGDVIRDGYNEQLDRYRDFFEQGKLEKLTTMEKEDYAKSIFDYQDVKDTIEYERECARNEGRVEGEKKAKRAMAKSMLEKGIDMDTILSITGLTAEEIEVEY